MQALWTCFTVLNRRWLAACSDSLIFSAGLSIFFIKPSDAEATCSSNDLISGSSSSAIFSGMLASSAKVLALKFKKVTSVTTLAFLVGQNTALFYLMY